MEGEGFSPALPAALKGTPSVRGAEERQVEARA